jgi:hypothetical protein
MACALDVPDTSVTSNLLVSRYCGLSSFLPGDRTLQAIHDSAPIVQLFNRGSNQ